MASKYLPMVRYYIPIAFPFLIQPSLVDDVLSRAIKKQIDEELSAINNNLDQLNDKKEEYIISLKKSSSSETTLEMELDKQSPLYCNLNEEIGKVKKRKAKLEAIKDDKQYISEIKSLSTKSKIKLLSTNKIIIIDRNTGIQLFDSDCIKKRTKKELTHYIQQLSDDHVQKIFSKFMDRDLQKKLKRANLAYNIIGGIACTFGSVGFGIMVCTLFYQLGCLMFRKLSIDEILARREVSFFQSPEIIALLCGLSTVLLGVLINGILTAYYEYYHKPFICNELQNIEQELDLDYKNNPKLKLDTEENPKSKVEQPEQTATCCKRL